MLESKMVQDCAQKAMYALNNSKIKMEDTVIYKNHFFSLNYTQLSYL